MSDLHARIKAAVTARLELAHRAEGVPWDFISVGFPRTPGRDAVLHLINANADPAVVIRACERDLRVLRRHRVETATSERTGRPAFCSTCLDDAPCPDVRDLAHVYRIPTQDAADA